MSFCYCAFLFPHNNELLNIAVGRYVGDYFHDSSQHTHIHIRQVESTDRDGFQVEIICRQKNMQWDTSEMLLFLRRILHI